MALSLRIGRRPNDAEIECVARPTKLHGTVNHPPPRHDPKGLADAPLEECEVVACPEERGEGDAIETSWGAVKCGSPGARQALVEGAHDIGRHARAGQRRRAQVHDSQRLGHLDHRPIPKSEFCLGDEEWTGYGRVGPVPEKRFLKAEGEVLAEI